MFSLATTLWPGARTINGGFAPCCSIAARYSPSLSPTCPFSCSCFSAKAAHSWKLLDLAASPPVFRKLPRCNNPVNRSAGIKAGYRGNAWEKLLRLQIPGSAEPTRDSRLTGRPIDIWRGDNRDVIGWRFGVHGKDGRGSAELSWRNHDICGPHF